MEQRQLVHVLVDCGFITVVLGRFDPLRHEICGDDVLDLLCVSFLVADPANQLVVINIFGSSEGDDLVHRFLDRRDVLLDELYPELVVVDPTRDLAVGTDW